MRRNKIIYLIALVLVVSILASCLWGCTSYKKSKAKSIHFEKIGKDAIVRSDLEKKSDTKFTLVENKTSDVTIVVTENIDKNIKRGVTELKSTIEKMTGVTLPISKTKDTSRAIYIGDAYEVDTSGVVGDGYVVEVSDNYIAIRGITNNGTANGIYCFIEDSLGAIFVSPYDTYTTHHDNIYIDKGRKIDNPATAWRDVYSLETTDNFWAAKLKLNAIDTLSEDDELVTKEEIPNDADRRRRINELRQYNEWGTWCHTMYSFVPPEKYFDEHPEYYSLFKGERIHKLGDRDAHLCLSNPEVYNIVETELLRRIEEHPEVKYWDFSVNDTSAVPGCQCENCKRMDKEAGGTGMGSLLPFLNKLARKVREVYPDREIYISTLAYFHTLKPPKGIKAEPNVAIKICSMEGDQGTSYMNPGNKKAAIFHDSLEEWSKVADHMIVWDYVVNFSHLLTPFPNFAVQGENQKFYEDNNIHGVFHQASRERGGEMAIMRAYILSKLMWQGSQMDLQSEVSKFVYAYYGEAADDVIDYLNATHKNLSDTTSHLGLYDDNSVHKKGYLSRENILEYNKIIERAKGKVSGKYRDRIEGIELNVKYAMLLMKGNSESDIAGYKAEIRELAKKQNITMSQEWQDLDSFLDSVKK